VVDCVDDELHDGVGMRHHDRVGGALDLTGSKRSGAFGHESQTLDGDVLVAGAEDEPGRQRLPGRGFRGLWLAEREIADRALSRRLDLRFVERDIGGELVGEERPSTMRSFVPSPSG
jgi:hypothetical protein